MVRFEGNIFSDFSVPLVFEGRYFIIEPGTPNPLVTVVVEHDREPVFEVLKNEPQQNPLTEVSRKQDRSCIRCGQARRQASPSEGLAAAKVKVCRFASQTEWSKC